ncbi:hypothetical protein BBJ28_00009157 [Nothophytophthora sp. Chile5]|nr:hypothetical protein BBJ28_00009157 [Nothophytophthora sp. Chile5]
MPLLPWSPSVRLAAVLLSLLVAAALADAAVAVADSLISSALGQLISVETVCAPDWQACPNGGRAFRDRAHDCDFTPCELVSPSSSEPQRVATPDPSLQNSSRWFGNEEFAVPMLHTRDMRLGRLIHRRVAVMLQLKVQRCAAISEGEWKRSGSGNENAGERMRCADVYLVDGDSGVAAGASEDLGTKGAEAYLSQLQTAMHAAKLPSRKRLVASREPWTRLAFYGRLMSCVPSVPRVESMLRLVHEELSSNMSNTTSSLPRLEPQLPTLVVSVNDSLAPKRDAPDVDWESSGVGPVTQMRVLGFLAKELRGTATSFSSSTSSDGGRGQLRVFATRLSSLVEDTEGSGTSEWEFELTPCSAQDDVIPARSHEGDNKGNGDSIPIAGALAGREAKDCACRRWRLFQLQGETGSTTPTSEATGVDGPPASSRTTEAPPQTQQSQPATFCH